MSPWLVPTGPTTAICHSPLQTFGFFFHTAIIDLVVKRPTDMPLSVLAMIHGAPAMRK
jgi:hypothetical protein